MRTHTFALVLRQWIEHRNPDNLRLHAIINPIGWLAITTVLSQIPAPGGVPLLGANIGAWFTVASVVYFLPLDRLAPLLVAALTVTWANLPFAPWGPGHTWWAGVLAPLLVFTASGLTALFAHIHWHEHAEYLNNVPKRRAALETAHAVIWGAFHFLLQYLLRAGWRPALKAEFEAAERAALLRRRHVPWENWARTHGCTPAVVAVPQTVDDLVESG